MEEEIKTIEIEKIVDQPKIQKKKYKKHIETPIIEEKKHIEVPIIEEDGNKYVIKKGDTLIDIATRYNMNWKELYARNKFVIGNNPENIKEGQILIIRY